MVGSEKRLLFVDESTRSSSPARRKEINAHVQKTRHERMRWQKIDALRTQRYLTSPGHAFRSQSASALPSEASPDSFPTTSGSSKGLDDGANIVPLLSQSSSPQESLRTEISPSKSLDVPSLKRSYSDWNADHTGSSASKNELSEDSCVAHASQVRAKGWNVALQMTSQGSSGDPFNATMIKMDAWNTSILQYYIQLMASGVFKAETAFLAPGQPFRHLPLLKKAISQSFSSEMHFFALMAGSTGRLRLNNKQYKLRAEPEVFAERAFKALRIYLQQEQDYSQIDPQIIFDIHALMLLATYAMDYSAARAHLSMIVYTVDKLYGFQSLSNIYQELCIKGDIGLARAAFTRPITPDTWYPSALPQIQMGIVEHSLSPGEAHTGQGFPPSVNLLGNTLLSIALHTADFARVAIIAWENGGTSSADAQWLSQSSHALLHRLLVLTPLNTTEANASTHPAPAEELTQHQEAVRTALIIWLSFITTYMAPTALGHQHPFRLKTALLQSRVTRTVNEPLYTSWRGNETLLLWLYSIGHSVAKITNSETVDYFASGFIEVAERLRIQTIAQLRGVVACFLYNERAQGPSLWELADYLRARQAIETDAGR